jgi:hypothetical protein
MPEAAEELLNSPARLKLDFQQILLRSKRKIKAETQEAEREEINLKHL